MRTRKTIQNAKNEIASTFKLHCLFINTHTTVSAHVIQLQPQRAAPAGHNSHTPSPIIITLPSPRPNQAPYQASQGHNCIRSPLRLARSSTSVAASTTGARARCPHATAQLLRITMHEIYPRSAVVNKAHAPAFGAIATRNMSSCACSVERAACRSLRRASRQGRPVPGWACGR